MKYYLLLIAAILVISCKEKKHPTIKHIIINGESYSYMGDTDIVIKKDTFITGWRVENSIDTDGIDTVFGFDTTIWSRGGMPKKPPTDSEYYKGATIIFNHSIGKPDWGHGSVVYPGYAVNDSVASDSFWKGVLISIDSTNSSKDKVPYFKAGVWLRAGASLTHKRDTVFINKKGYIIINHSGLPTLVIDRRN